MPFVRFLAVLALAALTASTASAQSGNPCSAAMSCDCPGISAGILTETWKKDCNACQGKILEKCAQSYAQHGNMERALNEAGFCKRDCSAFGPGAFPNVTATKKPSGSAAAPDAPPPRPGEMRLLCSGDARPEAERIGALQFTGCKNKQKRRTGLWKAYDAERKMEIEIIFRDGREVSRRERQAG